MVPRMDIWTPEQVAGVLQLSRDQVDRLLAAGKIPGMKIGGSWRVPSIRLYQWILEETRSAGAETPGADRTSHEEAT